MDLQQIHKLFKKQKYGFIYIKNYRNSKGELANILLNIGFSYSKAKQDDYDLLNEGVKYIESSKYDETHWNDAIEELKKSLIKPSVNRSKGQQEAYVSLNDYGSLKWYAGKTNNNGEEQKKPSLKIVGLLVEKSVIEKGKHPVVNSRPKTLAKNTIKKEYMRTGKIRNYSFEKIEGRVSVNGNQVVINMAE